MSWVRLLLMISTASSNWPKSSYDREFLRLGLPLAECGETRLS